MGHRLHVRLGTTPMRDDVESVPDALDVLPEVLSGQVRHGASTVMDLDHRRGTKRHQHHLRAACEECFHHCGSGEKEVGRRQWEGCEVGDFAFETASMAAVTMKAHEVCQEEAVCWSSYDLRQDEIPGK